MYIYLLASYYIEKLHKRVRMGNISLFVAAQDVKFDFWLWITTFLELYMPVLVDPLEVAESSARSVPVLVYPTDLCRSVSCYFRYWSRGCWFSKSIKLLLLLLLLYWIFSCLLYLMRPTRRFGSLFRDHINVTLWHMIDLWGPVWGRPYTTFRNLGMLLTNMLL
jgi:hypothetical protein